MESNKNVWYIGLGIAAVATILFMLLPTSVLRPVLYAVLSLGSVIIILLVLIQRGRGGGLAGALGGMGGYSAFGTRAGDIFTRITIVAAALWLLAAMALTKINVGTAQQLYEQEPAAVPSSKATDLTTSDTGTDSGKSSTTESMPVPIDGIEPLDKRPSADPDSKSQ